MNGGIVQMFCLLDATAMARLEDQGLKVFALCEFEGN